MGRKLWLLLSVFLLLLVLGGCADSQGVSAGRIIPPPCEACPFHGKWEVLEELGTDGNTVDAKQQWVGSSVQFPQGHVVFDGQVWEKLSYKVKRVDQSDYLMTKYLTSSDFSDGTAQKVDVVTVYAASNFLGEFMKIDDTRMIFLVQDKALLLQKLSDQTDRMLEASNDEVQKWNPDRKEVASGILLGLRILSDAGYTYRTLWIAAEDHQMHPVLTSEQLFFPRTSGFWEFSVQETAPNGNSGNILAARNVAGMTLGRKAAEEAVTQERMTEGVGKNEQNNIDLEQEGNHSTFKRIDYIGNDYVAIETSVSGVNRLQVLPVDKLTSTTKIKISDLLGDVGLSTYLNAREHEAAALREKGIFSIEKDELGENFGLVRKNGHWLLVGRLNYQSGGTFAQSDFELKAIPPVNLIYYDTLVLNWHNIKDRVPDALDAFTSPHKDIALVKTKNKLTVYRIGTEQLEETPLAEIELQEGATVIMAEWATGSYVDSWEKSFLSYGARPLQKSLVRIR